LSPDLVVRAINTVGARRMNRPSSEITGKSLHDLLSQESLEQRIPILKAAIASKSSQLIHAERSGLSLEESINPVLDDQGEVLLLAIYSRDITDQRRTARALEESEHRYRSIFEKNQTVKLIIDPDSGRILRANPAAAAFYGYPVDKLKLMNISNINTQSPAQIKSRMHAALDEKLNVFYFPHRLASGELREVEVHSSTIELDGKTVLYSIIFDITERKRSDEALRVALYRYQGIIEGTNAGTWEWNIKTGKSSTNETWATMLGYSLEELQPFSSQVWDSLRHPDDKATIDDLLQRHLAGELPYYDCEYRMKHRDGRWAWIHARGRVVARDESGSPLLMYGTHTDISERKKAEGELRQALLRNKNLLRELQHRAKNSIGMISSLIGLSEGRVSNEETRAVLEELNLRVLSIAELYNLLYVSGSSTEVELDDYCRKVTKAMRLMSRGILIEEDYGKVVVPISIAAPLGIILTEILTNALKYAYPEEGPGRIHVTLGSLPGGALLSVSDDGVGLPAGFDPDTSPGTGLLLIHGLVKQIGGELEIVNQEKGAGFRVKIPL
ncbi:MAG: PAS domain S-box protein, partial [Spirochaetota bacterium]